MSQNAVQFEDDDKVFATHDQDQAEMLDVQQVTASLLSDQRQLACSPTFDDMTQAIKTSNVNDDNIHRDHQRTCDAEETVNDTVASQTNIYNISDGPVHDTTTESDISIKHEGTYKTCNRSNRMITNMLILIVHIISISAAVCSTIKTTNAYDM